MMQERYRHIHLVITSFLLVVLLGVSVFCANGNDRNTSSRYQEPHTPYPYIVENVTFTNSRDGARLAGTLTIPDIDDEFPAVVLISGSGLQDRDETAYGHKPFKVLADDLTRRGIAVLRYDDRGALFSLCVAFRSVPGDC